jgi:hypothetical protein
MIGDATGARLGGADGAVALTSMRPIVTLMVNGSGMESGWGSGSGLAGWIVFGAMDTFSGMIFGLTGDSDVGTGTASRRTG